MIDWQAVSAIVNSMLAAATFGVLYMNRQQEGKPSPGAGQ